MPFSDDFEARVSPLLLDLTPKPNIPGLINQFLFSHQIAESDSVTEELVQDFIALHSRLFKRYRIESRPQRSQTITSSSPLTHLPAMSPGTLSRSQAKPSTIHCSSPAIFLRPILYFYRSMLKHHLQSTRLNLKNIVSHMRPKKHCKCCVTMSPSATDFMTQYPYLYYDVYHGTSPHTPCDSRTHDKFRKSHPIFSDFVYSSISQR